MTANMQEELVQTFEIVKHEEIAAPIDLVFETILEQMGPLNATPGHPMPMKLEAWPGGRWFRDLGDMAGFPAGHYWGTVQSIKAPSLLEICGPLFMSMPVVSHLQYRLKEVDGLTHLAFVHRAMGWIREQDRRGVNEGWSTLLDAIATAAAKKSNNG